MENVAYRHEQTELYFFAINTGHLAPKFAQVRLNLLRKIKKGNYDSSKALIAWGHVATYAAIHYTVEHCSSDSKYYQIFSTKVRREVAKELLSDFESQVKTGELEYLLN